MWTRRPPSVSERSVASAFAFGVLALVLAPSVAHADDAADDARLRAAYPMPSPSATRAAGIDLAKIALPGLQPKLREDHAPGNGGSTISFADGQGQVRVVLRYVVTADAASARSFVYARLRSVASVLSPSTLDEVAFVDDGGRASHLVVAAHANLAYAVDVTSDALTAKDVATAVQGAFVAGAPAFPKASLSLPAQISRAGTPVNPTASAGAKVRVQATGGYVTHSRQSGTVIHSNGPGRIDVTVIAADDLGRVTEITGIAQGQ